MRHAHVIGLTCLCDWSHLVHNCTGSCMPCHVLCVMLLACRMAPQQCTRHSALSNRKQVLLGKRFNCSTNDVQHQAVRDPSEPSADVDCCLMLMTAAAFRDISWSSVLNMHLPCVVAAAGAVGLSRVPPQLWSEQAPG